MNSQISGKILTFLSAAIILVVATTASEAYCELGTNDGTVARGCSKSAPRTSGGSNNNANAAAIGSAAGAIIGGIIGSANRPRTDAEMKAEVDREVRQIYLDSLNRQPSRKTKAAIRAAEADPSLDPWSTKTDSPTKTSSKAKSKVNERAPFADGKCASILPRKNRGVADWDYVTITNKCNFPIEVLTCYFEKGDKADEKKRCDGTRHHWGNVGWVKPKGSVTSVSTASKPSWSVKYFVCDMSEFKPNSGACLRPSSKL